MRIVLDTNVIVSGFLNPYGAPGRLLQYVTEGQVQLAYDARILAEYYEVLRRDDFHLNPSIVDDFMREVEDDGLAVAAEHIEKTFPDPSDRPFIEVALTSRVDYLVTGNAKHFPKSVCGSVRVIGPTEFLSQLSKI